MSAIAHADWTAEAKKRFGTDPRNWTFICPNCKDTANGHDLRAALDSKGRTEDKASDILGRVCIGRLLGALEEKTQKDWKGRGCDWVAYGLFQGPVAVTLPDDAGTIHCFEFAPAPATASS